MFEDGSGTLVAYALLEDLGSVISVSRILGHADHLRAGVMYLLMHDVLGRFQRTEPPFLPDHEWLMYDTWFGARSGIQAFKANIGFVPYWVTWRWRADRPVAIEAPGPGPARPPMAGA